MSFQIPATNSIPKYEIGMCASRLINIWWLRICDCEWLVENIDIGTKGDNDLRNTYEIE